MADPKRDRDHIAWSDPPKGPSLPYIPVYWAPAQGSYTLVVLSHAILGVQTHWVDGHTVPCLGTLCSCNRPKTYMPKRWKGFLACYDPETARLCMAEVTLDAAQRASDWLLRPGSSLRGLWIRLVRVSARKNAAVRVEMTAPRCEMPELPPAFDVEEALARIWGVR